MKAFSIFMAFYFTIGACLPRCDFGQLSKLEELISHYQTHRDQALAIGQSYDLLVFVYDHFIELHEEDLRHENLPCQSLSVHSMTLMVNDAPRVALVYSDISEEVYGDTKAQLHAEEIVFSIFHPPIV